MKAMELAVGSNGLLVKNLHYAQNPLAGVLSVTACGC
jgi:hypothetical protein